MWAQVSLHTESGKSCRLAAGLIKQQGLNANVLRIVQECGYEVAILQPFVTMLGLRASSRGGSDCQSGAVVLDDDRDLDRQE